MLGKKKEDAFFVMLREYAAAIQQMGGTFAEVIREYGRSEDAVERLQEMESDCDTKHHQIIDKLNAAFVTPFDREDIYTLAEQLDDVANLIEDAASRFGIYNVRSLREDAVEMGEMLTESADQIMILFDTMPDKKRTDETKNAIRRLNHLENQGDAVYRRALTRLFREETDAIELIRWKDIYTVLEDSLDACEHLADTVRGVIIKNA